MLRRDELEVAPLLFGDHYRFCGARFQILPAVLRPSRTLAQRGCSFVGQRVALDARPGAVLIRSKDFILAEHPGAARTAGTRVENPEHVPSKPICASRACPTSSAWPTSTSASSLPSAGACWRNSPPATSWPKVAMSCSWVRPASAEPSRHRLRRRHCRTRSPPLLHHRHGTGSQARHHLPPKPPWPCHQDADPTLRSAKCSDALFSREVGQAP